MPAPTGPKPELIEATEVSFRFSQDEGDPRTKDHDITKAVTRKPINDEKTKRHIILSDFRSEDSILLLDSIRDRQKIPPVF